MPNWTRNYVAFVGASESIDALKVCLNTTERLFEFGALYPAPEVLMLLSSHPTVMMDDEYQSGFGFLLDTPEAALEQISKYPHKHYNDDPDSPYTTENTISESLNAALNKKYGTSSWYEWTHSNWGTKWPGSNLEVLHDNKNILMVSFDTAWDAPHAFFEHVLSDFFGTMDVIAVAVDEAEACTLRYVSSTPESFHAYFSATISGFVELDDLSEETTCIYHTDVRPNFENIRLMERNDCFVTDLNAVSGE